MSAVAVGKISKLEFGTKSIWVIDYSNCPESEMIQLVSQIEAILLKEPKPQLLLSVFNDKVFFSSAFYEHAEKLTKGVLHRIDKSAFIGLSDVQKTILSGYNERLNRNFKSFETKEKAIAYLLDDNTTDRI